MQSWIFGIITPVFSHMILQKPFLLLSSMLKDSAIFEIEMISAFIWKCKKLYLNKD